MTDKDMQSLQKIAYVALLIAIEIVLSRFLSIATPIVKIGFAFLPIAIAGMLFGPLWAGAVGALGDFIGAILFPIGPYFPGFTLTAFLTGVTYGLCLYKVRTQWFWPKFWFWARLAAAVLVITGPLHLGLNTLWISVLYDKYTYLGLLPTRIVQCLIMAPIQFIVIWGMAEVPLRKLLRLAN